jgi:hypothetical protein
VAVLVADARTGIPIRDAQVLIDAYHLAQRTDSSGELRFTGLPSAAVVVTALRVGYRPMQAAASFTTADSSVVVFLMRHFTPTLQTVNVRGYVASPYMGEFEARMQVGLGRFLTVPQLDSSSGESVPDLVARRFPGLRALWNQSRTSVRIVSSHSSTSLRSAQQCAINVYVDGLPRFDEDELASFKAHDLVGVEYYSIAPPPQYAPGFDNSCGTLLLWTSRY